MTELPDRPEPLLVPDAASLFERYLPELRSTPGIDRVSAYFSLSVLAVFFGMAGFNLFGWIAAVVCAATIVVLGVGSFEAYRRRRIAGFDEVVQDRPWELYGEVAERFRRDLAVHRSRLLGPASEWGRARAPLEAAFQEARRSETYWEERARNAPPQSTAEEHHATARQLAAKFRAALDELDARSQILLDFFSTCEAKLAALESSKRDVEESRRLARLSSRAEGVTLDAAEAIARVGQDVLRHALEVGEALGALERLRIQQTAGDLPVEEVETVADQILASADSERKALSRLRNAVVAGPEG